MARREVKSGRGLARGWRNTVEILSFEISAFHACTSKLEPVIVLFEPHGFEFDEVSDRIPPTSQLEAERVEGAA